MKHKSNYIFTNKKHPKRGIMSTILGMISIISIVLSIYLTFTQRGEAAFNYGIAVVWSLIFSFVGIGLGIAARTEKDRFYLFAYIGILLNFAALAGISFILYAGAYGL